MWKLIAYSLVMVEGVDVLKWCGGELRRKSALHPDWNRRSLLQRRIRLRAFIFVLVIVPNLLKNKDRNAVCCTWQPSTFKFVNSAT